MQTTPQPLRPPLSFSADQTRLRAQVRLYQGADVAIGPGKAELLSAIATNGSISAAARQMGMSYRRAWLLVETMNRCFQQPLVISATGGRQGGGAQLSPLGQQVLAAYQHMMMEIDSQLATHAERFDAFLKTSAVAAPVDVESDSDSCI